MTWAAMPTGTRSGIKAHALHIMYGIVGLWSLTGRNCKWLSFQMMELKLTMHLDSRQYDLQKELTSAIIARAQISASIRVLPQRLPQHL